MLYKYIKFENLFYFMKIMKLKIFYFIYNYNYIKLIKN